MGNDGGSIPGRQDLVKEKEKEKRMQNDELVKQSNSKYCALSKEFLKKPIVSDRLGLMYNKESLIKALIDKRLPKSFVHITSLKDVKELNINIVEEETKIVCPLTLLEFSGLNNFFVLWKCGCVLSKKAMEELNMKDKCINCGENVQSADLVSLNYSIKEREEIFKKLLNDKVKQKDKREKEKLLNNKREKEKAINNKIKEDNSNVPSKLKKRKIEI